MSKFFESSITKEMHHLDFEYRLYERDQTLHPILSLPSVLRLAIEFCLHTLSYFIYANTARSSHLIWSYFVEYTVERHGLYREFQSTIESDQCHKSIGIISSATSDQISGISSSSYYKETGREELEEKAKN